MHQSRIESVTGRFVIMAVATLAGVAAFGWVLATHQPSTLDMLRQGQQDVDLAREVNEYRRRAQTADYEFDVKDAIYNQLQVVDLEPFDPRNWLDLATYYDRADDRRKARDARGEAADVQQRLAKAKAHDAEAWRRAAILLHAVGRVRDARRAYRRAAEEFIEDGRHDNASLSWARAAEILNDLGDVDEARSAWCSAGDAAAIELKSMFAPRNRADTAFWRTAGEYFIKAGELEKARAVLRDGITVLRMSANRPLGATVPDHATGWDLLIWSGYNLGWIHRRLGEEDLAQQSWRQSLKYIEVMVEMPQRHGDREWYNRACLRALTGDAEGAIDALEQAVTRTRVSRQHALADEDLRTLHDDERFHAVVGRFDNDPLQRRWR